MPGRSPSRPTTEAIAAVLTALPLVVPTRDEWAPLAAAQLPTFLADHPVCEQQVAVYALSLAGHYPGDHELVEKAAALALEEVQHFRRVVRILHRRGYPTAGRRPNRWVPALRGRTVLGREPWSKVDRLLFGALVEARSCERFTRLLAVVEDAEGGRVLNDLGPAEQRHWEVFYALAGRDVPSDRLAERWRGWLEVQGELQRQAGVEPTVHG